VSTRAKPELAPLPQLPPESERFQSVSCRLKRALLGRPLKTSELHQEKLHKRVALAVFSSDPISSTAYAKLYAIGVVTSFALAQLSMARHQWTLRPRGWLRGFVTCAAGTAVTGVVLVVIVVTKFTDGAWMVVIAIPVIVYLLRRVQATYGNEETHLRVEVSCRLAPPKPRHELLVLLDDIDRAAIEALHAHAPTAAASRSRSRSAHGPGRGQLRTAMNSAVSAPLGQSSPSTAWPWRRRARPLSWKRRVRYGLSWWKVSA
jgi:hypothetical protein